MGLGLLAALVVASGCGGESQDAARQRFIRKAEVVCGQANEANGPISKKIREAQEDVDADKVFAQLAVLTRRSAQSSGPYITRLAALEAPGDDREEIAAWVATLRREQTALFGLADAFAAQDKTAAARLSEQVDRDARSARAFAKGYGMPTCARGG